MSGTGARIAQIAGAGAFAVVGVLVAGAVTLGATGAGGDRGATEACLAPTNLAAGCGLELPSDLNGYGYIHDGTVSRTISDEQWSEIDQMVPSRTRDSVLQQTGDWIGDVHVEADWTDSWGSGRGEIGGTPRLCAPTVDFSDPALPVTWE